MSNLLGIGTIVAVNKTPGSFYKSLIGPLSHENSQQASQTGSNANQSIRFYWKTLGSVGGIPIIDHAELNLAPLVIQISFDIAVEVARFFFPPQDKALPISEADDDILDVNDKSDSGETKKLSRYASTKSINLSRMESMEDIISMKQRAENHCSFVFIKVPASQHLVSYKVKSYFAFVWYSFVREKREQPLLILKAFF
jgi:hypothetical protein